MSAKIGFDNEKYLQLQSEKIRERIESFGDKLYLELGGKLFDDYHASRVLPGFEPDSKIKMLSQLADKAEIVIVINAADIAKNKVRSDLGITYEADVLRLIDAFRAQGLYVGSVVISQYTGQSAADVFRRRLINMGIKVAIHYIIEGYPANIPLIVSDEGYGKNDYIETERPLVIVTAPGPGSGKLATCLSQLYHDYKRGIKAGYAKFETFPIWNLPLKHPVNLAYEAATADLNDVNMIDSFHLEAYGDLAVNYNRDLAAFPLLRTLFEKIIGECPYKSPTDMGVNMVGFCITDDDAVSTAAKHEIVRRYYATKCDKVLCKVDEEAVYKTEMIMSQAGITTDYRRSVQRALEIEKETGRPAVCIELTDGRLVTGKTTPLLGSSSAALLNALKVIAGIDDEIKLISQEIIEPVCRLKTEILGNHNPRLHTDETLIALSVCAATDEIAKRALDALTALRGAELHSTVVLPAVDAATFKKIGVNCTCEAVYETKKIKTK
ncbi:MAG: DUF1846 domain-containing protein [Clostridia bacterium]|nr:DUF1846 domain-containing protein [Clostridia bacterium]